MKKLRVILADDHALVRAGVRMVIETFPEIEVVGEAGTGREALEVIRRTRPDLAVLDIGMPEPGGLAVTSVVTKELPDIKVIILSMHRESDFVKKALRAGAMGYVVKEAATTELDAAIRAIRLGAPYISPAVSTPSLPGSRSRTDGVDESVSLTPRQQQVLRLVVQGFTMKQIATLLGLSVKTVEAHRAQVTGRLGIYDVPGLVRYAMRNGFLEADPKGHD